MTRTPSASRRRIRLAVRGWPLLVLVSLTSLVVAAQGSPGAAGRQGVRRLPPAELAANILAGLQQLPRPHRAVDQRFTLRGVPALEVPLGPYRLRLAARLPEVGDGAVGVELKDVRGTRRQLKVAVTRHVRALLTHAAVPLTPGMVLESTHVSLDTLWVEQPTEWERAWPTAENPVGWTVDRVVPAGAMLRVADLRRTLDLQAARTGSAGAGR